MKLHQIRQLGFTAKPDRHALVIDRTRFLPNLPFGVLVVCLVAALVGLGSNCAVAQEKSLAFAESRRRIESGEPTLLLFGTAHGLAPELTENADYTLPAIVGPTNYNHLSVRAAVAIICDRLLG